MNFVQLWLDLHNFMFLPSQAEKELRDIFGDITYSYYFLVFLNEKKMNFTQLWLYRTTFVFAGGERVARYMW